MAVERHLGAPQFECLTCADDQDVLPDTRPPAEQIGKDAPAVRIDGDQVQQAENPASPRMAGAGTRGFLGDTAAAALQLQLKRLSRIVACKAAVRFMASDEDLRPVGSQREGNKNE